MNVVQLVVSRRRVQGLFASFGKIGSVCCWCWCCLLYFHCTHCVRCVAVGSLRVCFSLNRHHMVMCVRFAIWCRGWPLFAIIIVACLYAQVWFVRYSFLFVLLLSWAKVKWKCICCLSVDVSIKSKAYTLFLYLDSFVYLKVIDHITYLNPKQA